MIFGGYSRSLTSPTQQNTGRLQWLDILKGIGIFLVVLAHVHEVDPIYHFVYAFHMPLFFIAAGWLYKERTTLSYAKHRFSTVMIPYFSFGLLTLIYWQLIERHFRASDMTFLQSVIGLVSGEYDRLNFNVHLWFLPCFFLTVIIYNGLRNVVGRRGTYIIAMVLSALYVVGVYWMALPSLPWGLNRVCQYLGFYAIGNWMSERCDTAGYKLNEMIETGRRLFWAVIATALLAIVFVISLLNLTSGIFWFITGTLGTVAVGVYSILLGEIGTATINNLISFLGRISLVVLCVHGPVYRAVSKILSMLIGWETDTVRSNFLFAVVIVVITLAICSVAYMVIDRFLPWMIGKQKRSRESRRRTMTSRAAVNESASTEPDVKGELQK